MDVTFLVTHYAQPEFLKICLDSIRKFYPNNRIIISQQSGDDFAIIKELIEKYKVSLHIEHNMKIESWVGVAIGLAKVCPTDFAVYIEHDAFLLRNLEDSLNKIRSGEYDAVGVEEVMPEPNLMRKAPGMMNQNFFMINMKRMKEIGLEKMRFDPSRIDPEIKNHESGYGISQNLEKKLFLPVTYSGYACGTYYGDVAHHFWYGSYKRRNTWFDNVNPEWLDYEAQRLVNDYWLGNIKIHETSI